MIVNESRLVLVDRSLVRSHESPLLSLINNRFPPRNTFLELCFEIASGVTQSKRYFSLESLGKGFSPCIFPVLRSTRIIFPFWDALYSMDDSGSGC